MEPNLRNILLGVLVIIIGLYILKISYDSFDNPPQVPVSAQTKAAMKEAHKSVPAVDPKAVQSAITGIRNVITERPDIILTIKEVLADPLINGTLYDILSILKPGTNETLE
jgi:hypothetical protein